MASSRSGGRGRHRSSSPRRRRRCQPGRRHVGETHSPRLESLEQRLVLSLTPAPDSFAVTAAQAAALSQGIGSLTSCLAPVEPGISVDLD